MARNDHEFELTLAYEAAEEGWLTATIPSVPGAISAGRTRAEARANVLDALRTMLSAPPEIGGHDTEVVRVRLEEAHRRELGRGI